MRQLTDARWPSELCRYVDALGRGSTGAVTKAVAKDYRLPAWNTVELSPLELQHCKLI